MSDKIREGFAENISDELQAAIDKTGYRFMHNTEEFKSSQDLFKKSFVSIVSDSLDIIMSAVVSLAVGIKGEGEEAVVNYDKSKPLIINWRINQLENSDCGYYRARLTCYTSEQYEENKEREFLSLVECKCNPFNPHYKGGCNE